MGIGCTILDQDHNVVYEQAAHLDGKGSVNYAEYSACVEVLKWLMKNEYDQAFIRGDSRLVINQLNGEWQIREGTYVDKAIEAKAILENLCCVRLKWTSRNNNIRADELSKIGLAGTNYECVGEGCN